MRHSLGEVPADYIVSEYDVYSVLSKLNIDKALGPNGLSNGLLKSYADLLAAPLCAIIHSSIRRGVVPWQWKLSRISPIPKVFPPMIQSYICNFFSC